MQKLDRKGLNGSSAFRECNNRQLKRSHVTQMSYVTGCVPLAMGQARRNCASDARTSPPPIFGTMINSIAVTPTRSTA